MFCFVFLCTFELLKSGFFNIILDLLEIGIIHLTEKVFPTQKCAASIQVSRHRIFTTWGKMLRSWHETQKFYENGQNLN